MPIRIVPILIVILSLASNVFAQKQPSYGIFFDLSLNQHNANFQQLPGVPSCCPRYEKGTGTGPAFGGLYEMPLTEFLDLEFRLLYHSLSGTLSETETTTVLLNSKPAPGAFEHTLNTGLSTISIEPMLGLRIVSDLRINFGISAGILLAKSYIQQEAIVLPDGGGTFLDSLGSDSHSRLRNQFSGTIPGTSSLQVAALCGISYSLPLDLERSAFLMPEIIYTLGLTQIASDLKWNVNSIRIGIGLVFSPLPKPIREIEEKIDTIRIQRKGIIAGSVIRGKEEHSQERSERDHTPLITEIIRRTDTLFDPKKSALEAAISAKGLDANGNELPMVRLKVEEFSSTLMTPLLNYIFFDENSSEIPQRYNQLSQLQAASFAIEHNHSPAKLETYHQILNILGRRLSDDPGAVLTLTGCNQDIRDESGNLKLSRARAEAVKKYFTDIWHIRDGRIRIEVRNLSAKAANPATQDGAEENRRVEISSSDPKILFPVITTDTLRTSNPPTLRFKPQVIAETDITSWKVSALQDGKQLKIFEGSTGIPQALDWNIESSSVPRFSGDIEYKLEVKDADGNTAGAVHAIPTEQITIRKKREERRGDTTIDRFSLILFDVGSYEITNSNIPIVTLIKEYIKPLSNVSVIGYTDRLGEASYNQQLSERRAKSIASALTAKKISSKGVGPRDLYDSRLPEGRLYTRTVDVVIETPVK